MPLSTSHLHVRVLIERPLRLPQVVFEVDFLGFLLGLLSRAGVTFTGFIAVYNML
jgi:hypothetical protein